MVNLIYKLFQFSLKKDHITIPIPYESRDRCITYSAPLTYDFCHEKYIKNKEGEYIPARDPVFYENMAIGDLPIMLGCKFDILQLFPDIEERVGGDLFQKKYINFCRQNVLLIKRDILLFMEWKES